MVFDEYHFGAWRDTAKELFEGEDEAVAEEGDEGGVRRRSRRGQRGLSELSTKSRFPADHHKAYLYLSGTPFKALASGEFIEEQIFNWTYTDEQRARAEFAARHPDS